MDYAHFFFSHLKSPREWETWLFVCVITPLGHVYELFFSLRSINCVLSLKWSDLDTSAGDIAFLNTSWQGQCGETICWASCWHKENLTYGYYSLINLCCVLLFYIHPVASCSLNCPPPPFFVCHVIKLMLRPHLLMNAGTKSTYSAAFRTNGAFEKKNLFPLLVY